MENDKHISDDRNTILPNEEYRMLLRAHHDLKKLFGLRKSWDGELLVVEIDVTVLDYLISNAVAFSPEYSEFELYPISDWIQPAVHVGFKRGVSPSETL